MTLSKKKLLLAPVLLASLASLVACGDSEPVTDQGAPVEQVEQGEQVGDLVIPTLDHSGPKMYQSSPDRDADFILNLILMGIDPKDEKLAVEQALEFCASDDSSWGRFNASFDPEQDERTADWARFNANFDPELDEVETGMMFSVMGQHYCPD